MIDEYSAPYVLVRCETTDRFGETFITRSVIACGELVEMYGVCAKLNASLKAWSPIYHVIETSMTPIRVVYPITADADRLSRGRCWAYHYG